MRPRRVFFHRSAAFTWMLLLSGMVRAADPKRPTDAAAPMVVSPASSAERPARIWFRLVNVTIPPDSTHRKRDDLDRPPQVFVVIEKNGELIKGQSSIKTGWSVDFADKAENMWPIRVGTDDRYSIEVWDWNKLWDVQILKITGLSGEDFRMDIFEHGGALDEKSRLTRITFKETSGPEEKK